jgi:sigma-B regulation protein RsbU (phosphoserine phosphatase)
MSQPTKVLIVDDEELVRLVLRALMEDLGYLVVEAVNGKEGLDVFNRGRPDLVLADLRMPVMDGLSMITALREKSPETPVVVISGAGTVSDAVDSLRLGAWDYVVKPVTDALGFEIVIKRTLEKAQLLRENRRYREHLEDLVRERTEELRDSEARYRRLLESVTSYVYTVTLKDGRPCATVHGLGCEAVTGFTPEEHTTDTYLWYLMVHDDDRPLILDTAQRIVHEGLPISIEHRIYHKNGTIRWVQNTLVPHRTAKGEFLSYDGIIADITERKEMERHRLRVEQLESEKKTIALETLRQLMVTLSHYLLNASTIIGGMVRRCERVKSEAERLPALKTIEEQAKKMEAVIAALKRMTEIKTVDYTQKGRTLMIDVKKEIEETMAEMQQDELARSR